MIIRPEEPRDIASIRAVTKAAFDGMEFSSQTESAIVDALRASGVLTVSLVAEIDGAIIGHVASSPVKIDGLVVDWFGLGPVSVLPAHQTCGVGSALINMGLSTLVSMGARGCVVLGEPEYYCRFGFSSNHALSYSDAPSRYFQSLSLKGTVPTGAVSYDISFEAV